MKTLHIQYRLLPTVHAIMYDDKYFIKFHMGFYCEELKRVVGFLDWNIKSKAKYRLKARNCTLADELKSNSKFIHLLCRYMHKLDLGLI